MLSSKQTFVLAFASLLAALWTASASAGQVRLEVSLDKPTMLAEKKQAAFVKVGLTGFKLDGKDQRAPVNVAIVLDKSGSMQGDKIAKAKDAAIAAIGRLGSDDIVAVVAYDSTVQVIVPATKLSDKQSVIEQIRRIEAGGSTALFAGVSKGADELRKFLDKNRVNRVILLSDGLANVGPQSPSELGALGASLMKEGISVSTMGLGLDYNEDLMTKLAQKQRRQPRLHRAGRQPGAGVQPRVQRRALGGGAGSGHRHPRGRWRASRAGAERRCGNQRPAGHRADEPALQRAGEVSHAGGGSSRHEGGQVSRRGRGPRLLRQPADEDHGPAHQRRQRELQPSRWRRSRRNSTPTCAPPPCCRFPTSGANWRPTLRDQGDIEGARKVLLENSKYLGENAAKYNVEISADALCGQSGSGEEPVRTGVGEVPQGDARTTNHRRPATVVRCC